MVAGEFQGGTASGVLSEWHVPIVDRICGCLCTQQPRAWGGNLMADTLRIG